MPLHWARTSNSPAGAYSEDMLHPNRGSSSCFKWGPSRPGELVDWAQSFLVFREFFCGQMFDGIIAHPAPGLQLPPFGKL